MSQKTINVVLLATLVLSYINITQASSTISVRVLLELLNFQRV